MGTLKVVCCTIYRYLTSATAFKPAVSVRLA